MFNINFSDSAVNCTIWCMDTLRTIGVTDSELKSIADSLKIGEKSLLIQFDPEAFENVELYMEFIGIRNNKTTGKEEKFFRFIKKWYAHCTYTYYSCEFTID